VVWRLGAGKESVSGEVGYSTEELKWSLGPFVIF